MPQRQRRAGAARKEGAGAWDGPAEVALSPWTKRSRSLRLPLAHDVVGSGGEALNAAIPGAAHGARAGGAATTVAEPFIIVCLKLRQAVAGEVHSRITTLADLEGGARAYTTGGCLAKAARANLVSQLRRG